MKHGVGTTSTDMSGCKNGKTTDLGGNKRPKGGRDRQGGTFRAVYFTALYGLHACIIIEGLARLGATRDGTFGFGSRGVALALYICMVIVDEISMYCTSLAQSERVQSTFQYTLDKASSFELPGFIT